MIKTIQRLCLAAALLISASAASAHHTYAMFDDSRKLTVSGTVAKLEWRNPHVFVWVYVPKKNVPGEYELYAFENGPINLLARLGWTKNTLNAGDTIFVEYWPLKDGGRGGHFIRATLADGRVMLGAGGPGSSGPLPDASGVIEPTNARDQKKN